MHYRICQNSRAASRLRPRGRPITRKMCSAAGDRCRHIIRRATSLAKSRRAWCSIRTNCSLSKRSRAVCFPQARRRSTSSSSCISSSWKCPKAKSSSCWNSSRSFRRSRRMRQQRSWAPINFRMSSNDFRLGPWLVAPLRTGMQICSQP